MITRRKFLALVGTVFLSAGALVSYATGVEAMGRPKLRTYRLTPPRWPEGLRLKVAVVSDIHGCSPWMDLDRIKGICDQIDALDADLIILAGDYVNAMRHDAEYLPNDKLAEVLTGFRAPLGVHAILGNHDYWQDLSFETDPDHMPPVGRAMRAAGITVYKNKAVQLTKDGIPFWLAGIDDQLALNYSHLTGPVSPYGLDDLPATLAQVTDDAPVLLMVHEPDIFPEVPDRVSLTVAGHTHGGQVNIFGWSPVSNSMYGARYRGGHIVEDGRHLIVSRGLGCSGLPVRLGVWPEVLIMELG